MAQEGIWALRFGTAAAYEKFVTRYNDKLFVNTYGVDNDEVNRSKVDTLLLIMLHGRSTILAPFATRTASPVAKCSIVSMPCAGVW